ncbi:DUF362 domain-containing protein [Candidatus Hecatella orcuttiae]|uniref:DUF362 domain-containing protein n=1 Tax=Candidatus Hecatella orcuttiae TaxID=1935119 RepID=UPI002867F358|nr:DUF362 domain-containing protein [Candidatus Hecatella orcuttiae]
MAEVYFFDYGKGTSILPGLEKLFYSSGMAEVAAPGARVAVKVHMGERGNLTYLRPPIVRKVVELVKAVGGVPFVADTTVLYPQKRFTARDCLETAAYNGFTPETVGAPIVIADGEDGYQGVSVEVERTVDGCRLREVKVASAFLEADAMIVLSHAKGHLLSGFGGALKNLAMGCTTKHGKAAQHASHGLGFDGSKCDGCGKCVEACVYAALRLEGGKAVRDLEKCMHCCNCLFVCEKNAFYWPEGCRDVFQVYIAHAAYAVAKVFKKGRMGFLNFVQDVTSRCDCCTTAEKAVTQDVGILASSDPVAVDKASVDLIDQAPKLAQLPHDPPDILGKINGTNSLIQLRTAQKLGLGSLKYELTTI